MPSIDYCAGCGAKQFTTILDMGMQPLAERMTPDAPRHPLRLVQCLICRLVQLSFIADGHEVFPLDHPYATGNTGFLRDHFAGLAERLIIEELHPGELVVDIGSNDGTFLKGFGTAYRKVGVEPTNQAKKCDGLFPVWQHFFTTDVSDSIVIEHGQAAVVTACNVLAHVPDVHDFLEGVYRLLKPGGLFVTENHDLRSITEGLQIDTVYHEHLRYYSVASLSGLLARHELDVVRVEPIPTHGGSFRTFARRNSTQSLAIRSIAVAGKLERLLAEVTKNGADVYGVGATTRAAPLMHYAKITEYIEAVCEVEGSEKIGLVMPGTGIPVVPESQLIYDQPEYALLFSWHIAADLVRVLRRKGFTGKFIVPLPEPRVTDGKEFLG